MLLSLARGIFVDQTNLDRLVLRILTDAQGLVSCQRCILYLVNPGFTKVSLPGRSDQGFCQIKELIYRVFRCSLTTNLLYAVGLNRKPNFVLIDTKCAPVNMKALGTSHWTWCVNWSACKQTTAEITCCLTKSVIRPTVLPTISTIVNTTISLLV